MAANNQFDDSLGGSCFKQNSISNACWNDFFRNYGRRVFRRPLTANEISNLLSHVQKPGLSTAQSRSLAIHLLFRSPNFLFHIEDGIASNDSQRVRLSSYEIANRISYAIIGGPPDANLAAAADSGALVSLNQIETQARRLLQTQQAKQRVGRFYSDWLQIGKVKTPEQNFTYDIKVYGYPDDWVKPYTREINDFLNHVTWKINGTFSDLMTQKIAFLRTAMMYRRDGNPNGTEEHVVYSALAKMYGLNPRQTYNDPNTEDPRPYSVPNHPGIIMRTGFLSSGRLNSADPITRGVYLLRRILCQPLPTPDFTIINERALDPSELDPKKLSTQQLVTKKTAGTSCMACHSQINPLGFSLEMFDPHGEVRTKEQIYDMSQFYERNRGIVAEHNLAYPVNNVDIVDRKITVTKIEDLTNAIASSPTAQACMAKFVIRHNDRRKESLQDSCAIEEAQKILAEGKPLTELFVKSIANEDIFWRKK